MALALKKRVEEKHAWSRQPGESTQAYARFLVYRDQSPDQRSARRVGVSQSLAFRWSKRFAWVERVQAWDDWLLAEADALNASTVLGLRRRQLDAGLTLVDSAKAGATALDPAKQNAESIVLLLDAGVRHARVSLGLPAVDGNSHLAAPSQSSSVAVQFGLVAPGPGAPGSSALGSVRVGPAWLTQAQPNEPVVQVGEQVLAEEPSGQPRTCSDPGKSVDKVVNSRPGKLAGDGKLAGGGTRPLERPGGGKDAAKRRTYRGGASASAPRGAGRKCHPPKSD